MNDKDPLLIQICRINFDNLEGEEINAFINRMGDNFKKAVNQIKKLLFIKRGHFFSFFIAIIFLFFEIKKELRYSFLSIPKHF